MRKKTTAEMEKSKLTKAARSLIRLKHSLAADEEINAVLPDTLEEFDAALSRGELKELKSSLSDVLGGDGCTGDSACKAKAHIEGCFADASGD